MARKSTASLTVLPVQPLAHITVPNGLSAAEAALWREVVDSKPAEWFGPDSAPLLVEYVRAKITCDQLDELVKKALGADDSQATEAALRARDREAKRLAMLGTKLRLTQQSRYTPQAAATANKRAGMRRPWESGHQS